MKNEVVADQWLTLGNDKPRVKEEYERWHSKVITHYIDKKFYRWLKSIARPKSSELILDVGCGKGIWLSFLENMGTYRVGVDISITALKKAKRLSSADFVLADGERLPFKDSSFHKIFCLGSLEHFPDSKKGAVEISRVLKEDGIGYVFLPNLYFVGHVYLVFRTGEPPDEAGQHFSEKFTTRKGWEKVLTSAGLKVLKCFKYNRISKASRKVSTITRILYNIFIAPFLPLNLSYAFLFVVKPDKSGNGLKLR